MKANFTETRQSLNSRINFSKKSLLFSVLLALLAFTKVNAQNVNFIFDPAITNTTVGQTITVHVVAQFTSANPMDAAVVNFSFDNTILQATAVTNTSPTLTSFVGPTFDNGTGTINFVGVDLAPPYQITTDTLLSITFNVLAVPGGGSTTLVFNRPPSEAAVGGGSILNTTTNGVVNISAVGCGTPPTATIALQAGPATCDANAFNLVLSAAANGTSPFDLNITSPSGTTTYNDIAVGGIITNFVPPSDRLWPAVQPALTNDDVPYTFGVRFSTSVTGFVKGVRFLTSGDVSAVPGNYTGQLWTNTGTLLASGTFAGPITPDSWQELLFTEPILIAAGTPYVASYNIGTSNFYASTTGGLTGPFTNGTVTALAGGGLFIPGTPVAFPTTATNNNYWADVIFAPNNYSFALNSVTDALGCTNNPGIPLQTLNVTSVDCSTLPVSLINFSATPKDNAVLLRWATASEFNNLGFELQRSIDGNNGWTAVAFINGAGNSNSTINYSYVDENLSASRYYYRLKQIDIDQRFAYSPIVSAQLDGKQAFDLQQNFPNPFRGETIIRFTLPQKTSINLSIFDMNGRLVKVLANGSKDSGTHAVTLNSGILTSGLYYYKLQAGDFSAVKKLTIR